MSKSGRTCKLVEASFDPEEGSDVSLPELPSVPIFRDASAAPDADQFDLGTVAGVQEYREAIAEYVNDAQKFESEVDALGSQLDDHARECDDALDNAEPAQTFVSFQADSINRQMELSGFNRHDDIAIMLRGDYDRMVHAADEDCACVFGSDGRCIHRGCGLAVADWEVQEAKHA